MSARRVVVGLALNILLAGCAGEVAPSATSGTPEPSSSASFSEPSSENPSSHGSPEGTGEPTESSSTIASPTPTPQNPQDPPNFLESFLDFIFGSTPSRNPCEVHVVAGTTTPKLFSLERLDTTNVCFKGLGPSQPTIEVLKPSGQQVVIKPISGQGGEWEWEVDASPLSESTDELGEYAFTVSTAGGSPSPSPESSLSPSPVDGATSIVAPPAPSELAPAQQSVTSGRFTIASRDLDDEAVQIDNPVAAGHEFRIVLAGFPTRTDVQMAIYQYHPSPEPRIELLQDLPTLTTDNLGEAVSGWDVPAGAAPGRYVLWMSQGPSTPGCGARTCLDFGVEGTG